MNLRKVDGQFQHFGSHKKWWGGAFTWSDVFIEINNPLNKYFTTNRRIF